MSTKIIIDIDQENKCFILSGQISNLLNIRRARITLFDYFNASINNSQEVIIPFDEETKEEIIKSIRSIIEKFGFSDAPSENVKIILSDYFQEERNFLVFSKQAYQIRNNDLDEGHTADFYNFTKVVTEKLSKRILYPLQLLSAYHLAFSQSACNFSVPGSGKTSIVFGAYCYLKNLLPNDPKKIDKLVIIGPLSSFGPWEQEYKECYGKSPSSIRLSGGVSKEDRVRHFYSNNPKEITLISYNGVANMLEDLKYFLRKYKCMVVLDEAHKIKNTEGGLFASSTLELSKFGKSRVVLTGTPAPNGYEDIYNLFKFIWPTKDLLGLTLYQLKELSDFPNAEKIQLLTENASPYFLRIRKSDLHLPEPIENDPIFVEMGEIQQEIYRFIEKNYLEYFISQKNESNLYNFLARARLIRLMQVSTNPALLNQSLDTYFSELGYSNNTFIDDSEILHKIVSYQNYEVPPKFISAGSIIRNIIEKGEKVIVWAIFIANLHSFQNYLMSIGIPSKLLYGATPIEVDEHDDEIDTREKIIREFHQSNCPYKVIIANPFAVSESISLHKACHNALYLERTFNAAQFIQSKDRIHRVGMTVSPNYFYILSNNNLDKTIHERLIEKENRMIEIIEREPIPLFNRILSDDENKDDILRLINNYEKSHTNS